MTTSQLASKPLELLWDDGELALLRIRADGEAGPRLILKTTSTLTSPSALSRLQNAYRLRDRLDPAWATLPRSLEHHDGRPTLELDDPGGELLSRVLETPRALEDALRIAIGICRALGAFHELGLLHKDIKPAHLLVDTARLEHVWLTGFGIASWSTREQQAPVGVDIIAGTFAYMAPEQTGRMNRSIDSRSDLYALGVTLYELFSGALPFTAPSPIEWIHCHVAREPAPLPARADCPIPDAISAIVMKLLAKNAEDRFQTAAGAEADLRRCLNALQHTGRIDTFALGANDTSTRLRIPEKLYGRQAQIGVLLAAFDRVVERGVPELVLVSGYAGIGKSSVVSELHQALVPPRGLFASGKFDQYKRDIPYATLAQAFRSLVLQILGQSAKAVAPWRDALQDSVGTNGQLILNLVPELELILGPQPAVPDLPAKDARSRFHATFRRFVGVFATKEHPLALFLDDLQWLDAGTLDLVEHLLSGEQEVRNLLLVGAYRDNEVGAGHALRKTLGVVQAAGILVNEISLGPLGLDHVEQLVAESLRVSPSASRELASLLHERTSGNPFFTIQFLTSLVEEGVISFDHATTAWTWDLNQLRAKGFTENVADLMAAKLDRFSEVTRRALTLLACLGNSADIATLSRVHEDSRRSVDEALNDALLAGLIARREAAFTFRHDRVQEAAYALLGEAERGRAHLRIGRILAASATASGLEETIFEIVSHFNRASQLVTSESEGLLAAELNLTAGRRAKAAMAYDAALGYALTGSAFLTRSENDAEARGHRHPPPAEQRAALEFSLEFLRAECELLTGALSAADDRLERLSQRVERIVDRASVAGLRLDLFTVMDRSDRSVAVGLEFLKHVGIVWTANPTQQAVDAEFEALWQRLGDRPVEQLADLPPMTDPAWRATIDVFTKLHVPSLFSDEHLPQLIIARMANLSLEHGNSDGSCFAYGWVGAILCNKHFRRHETALQFARMSIALLEKPGFGRFKARVYSVFGYVVTPWVAHLRTGLEPLRRSYAAARDEGDVTFAAYAPSFVATLSLGIGLPLNDVQTEAQGGLEFARKARFGLGADFLSGNLLLIRALRGVSIEGFPLGDSDEAKAEFESRVDADPHLAIAACWYWIRSLQARFFAGDIAGALRAAASAAPLLWTSSTSFESCEYHFYAALAQARQCESAVGEERSQLLASIEAHHGKLAEWAAGCAENFDNRVSLVAAERARLDERVLDAQALYERAIEQARAQGFVNNEALANELAAHAYEVRAMETIARAYLRNARYCYLRWGALAKVEQLDQHRWSARPETLPRMGPQTVATQAALLDLNTVLEASQAISGQITPSELTCALLRLAVEHAGAQRGVLVLPHGDNLWLEAEATTSAQAVSVAFPQVAATPRALPASLLHHVIRTRESVLLEDLTGAHLFSHEPYFLDNRSGTVLCLPLVKQKLLKGVLYLENRAAAHAFAPSGVALLQLLASQAAIALENARMHEDYAALEDRIRLALDTIPSLAWYCAADGAVQFLNKRWLAFTGMPEADVLGWQWSSVIHPADVAVSRARWREATAVGAAIEYECRIRRFDGQYRWFLCRAEPMQDARGRIVKWYGTNTDIDERKRAEALLAGEKLLLELIAKGKSLASILTALCTLVEAQYESALASVLLVDEQQGLKAGAGPNLPASYLAQSGASPCAALVSRKEAMITSDIESDPLWAEQRALALSHGLRACWASPILAQDGSVLGAFATYYRTPKSPTADERAVIDQISNLASIAIERANAEVALRREAARLQASLDDKEALLREVHHRVKNNLQLISSLLSLQATRSADPSVAELLSDSRNRVRSMALVHENLYRAGRFARISMASHIQGLCAHLGRAYGLQSGRIGIDVQVSDLNLEVDRAVACG